MQTMRFSSLEGMRPTRLQVSGWRQFGLVDVELHPQLSVLVGPNGTGKSTLLSLLSLVLAHSDGSGPKAGASRVIGSLRLASGYELQVFDDERSGEQSITMVPTHVAGSFHHATKLLFGRADTSLRSVLIPVGGSSGNRAYVVAKHIATFASASERRAGFLKKLLTQWETWTIFSAQSSSMIRQHPDELAEQVKGLGRGSPEQLFERFANLFIKIAGEACGIQAVVIEDDQLIAKARTGSFSFDGISHGLGLVALLLWDCVLLTAAAGGGLMLIDEPENHLHPGLQRSLMATLVSEFPTIQFVVATHSPFFVGAARESRVCLLGYDSNGRVTSRMLRDQEFDRGGTANDILREALDTTTSRPVWVEEELRSRVAKFVTQPPGREVVAALHEELKREGQADLLPDAVRVLKKMHDEREEIGEAVR